MEKYDFAEVYRNGDRLYLSCTDDLILDEIIAELEKVFSKMKYSNIEGNLPNGKSFSYYITLENPLLGWWWLIQQFGCKGWEPVHSITKSSADINYFSCKKLSMV